MIPDVAISEIEDTARGYWREGQIIVCKPCQKIFLYRCPWWMTVAQVLDFSVREAIWAVMEPDRDW